jgi:hypothetical protein
MTELFSERHDIPLPKKAAVYLALLLLAALPAARILLGISRPEDPVIFIGIALVVVAVTAYWDRTKGVVTLTDEGIRISTEGKDKFFAYAKIVAYDPVLYLFYNRVRIFSEDGKRRVLKINGLYLPSAVRMPIRNVVLTWFLSPAPAVLIKCVGEYQRVLIPTRKQKQFLDLLRARVPSQPEKTEFIFQGSILG